jgi:hypothetical protein
MVPWIRVPLVFLALACLPVRWGWSVSAVDFSRDIQPLLAEHCLQCHGPDKAEAGLDLTQRDRALGNLDSGLKAIVPGQPAASHLLERVRAEDPDLRMPPGDAKPLKADDVAKLEQWIREGAEFQMHWAFRSLTRPVVPGFPREPWVRNPIDAFILAQLRSRRVTPSAEATPAQLIRRLHLDLTGLLPSPEQVSAFEKASEVSAEDSSARDRAYEQLVDQLLASPHYGERWGRHWLDLARYADSDGYEKDRPRPDAYVYRDWVIEAFNQNMPFDQFTIEQLAGDLLLNATPRQRIATAFNRQTLTNTEGGVDQEEYRVAAVFDRTDTLGSVWLGLTVGCAKCHTHKYDPIPHADYYRLFAFFNEADEQLEKLPIGVENEPALLSELLPRQQALQRRYRELADDEKRWEEEQRSALEGNRKLPLVVVDPPLAIKVASQAGLVWETLEDGSLVGKAIEDPSATELASPSGDEKAGKIPATDTYTVTVSGLPEKFTGLRLETIPDRRLGRGGAGLSSGGNFVLTHLSAAIVDADGQIRRELGLQRPEADFEQTGFKAADVLNRKPNSKKGWAVSPKLKEAHWLQVRTLRPESLRPGEQLRVTIEQSYGGQHLLGRFRFRALTGDEAELHLPASIITALRMYPEKRTNETRDALFDHFVQQDPQVQELQRQIEDVLARYQAEVMPVRTLAAARQTRATHRFDRGDFLSPAEQVFPTTLSALPSPDQPAANRLDLAKWLVGPSNPLTPRVIANQFWSRLFGAGLVRSVGDFGVRGELPSHPELLDWLAHHYREELRWNTKEFLKTILMSSTYRQSSAHRPELQEADPLNLWLARQNRLRVEGELVRDLGLQVAGLLSPRIGGPSVFPPMPPELAKLSYANNFSWDESRGEDRYRRGMYTFFKRTIPHPTLMTFDCPDANLTCVNRSVSNTPLQALTLLNNESFLEASQALAKRIWKDRGLDDQARLSLAIQICLTRAPNREELERLQNLLAHAREFYRDQPDESAAMVGEQAVAGLPNAELAAWIAAVRVLINLDEFITRE